MRRIYFDWAAAAPVSPRAARAFRRALQVFGNPSSPHDEGRAARALLDDARTRIARLAGVKAEAVIFTAGATEANALAILGQVRALMAAGRHPQEIHVLYLPSAHASTRAIMRMLVNEGVKVEPLILTDGAIDLQALATQITDHTALVAVEAVCGETGTRFATRDTRRVLDAARKTGGARIRLHVDAAQLPRAGSFERTHLGADTIALDAQKVGGVRGIGVLIAPRGVAISPLYEGGGQERGLRPGTESPALAVAFATALEQSQEDAPTFMQRAAAARAHIYEQIHAAHPDIEINQGKDGVPHILNLTIPGRDTDYLAALLNEAGFAIATRSACATDDDHSVAVAALTGDAVRARHTIRISWGATTPSRSLMQVSKALQTAIQFLDAHKL